ncbi:MAG: hypothetical protein AAF430_07895 [Myxococcota bacterium]
MACFALGCASLEEPKQDNEGWADEVKSSASAAADVTARGAKAAGSAMGTAYRGVRDGYATPEDAAYGPPPQNYARTIKKHMVRFEGIPAESSFQFGRPERGYMNKGILAGGSIAWQGYLVEVRVVQESLFASQARPIGYVVRMKDGDVVEVMEADYADALRWTDRREDDPADSGTTHSGVAAPADD